MKYFEENRVSEALLRLLTRKEVQHFNKVPSFDFSEIDRDNYFRKFEQAQVAEIAEFGLPRSVR